jgi:hypothetical protein
MDATKARKEMGALQEAVRNVEPVDAPDKDEAYVARFFKTSLATVRRWRKNGAGPRWYKLGAMVRYRESDLFDFLEKGAR